MPIGNIYQLGNIPELWANTRKEVCEEESMVVFVLEVEGAAVFGAGSVFLHLMIACHVILKDEFKNDKFFTISKRTLRIYFKYAIANSLKQNTFQDHLLETLHWISFIIIPKIWDHIIISDCGSML